MHAIPEALLAEQHECLAAWQLRAAGWTERQVESRLPGAGLRQVEGMNGVWTVTFGGRWRDFFSAMWR